MTPEELDRAINFAIQSAAVTDAKLQETAAEIQEIAIRHKEVALATV